MRVDPNEQGSAGWKRARLGILTASEFHRVITPKTMKPAAGARSLVEEKAAEWAIGEPLENYSSGLMERGNEMEEEAARMYALETGTDPERVGLCLLDNIPVGASPDRIVGADGLLEIKCPGPKAMVGYILSPVSLREDYLCQVQGQLLVTGRAWCDLYAYSPAFPAVLVRCQRDEDFIAALLEAAEAAAEALEEAKHTLREKGVESPLEAEPEPEPEEPDAPEHVQPPTPSPIPLPPPLECLEHADQTCPRECVGRAPF